MLRIPLLDTDSLQSKTPKRRLSRLDSNATDSSSYTPKTNTSPKAGGSSPKMRKRGSVRNFFALQPSEVPSERIMTYREKLDKILAAPHRTREEARFLYEDLQDTPFCTKYLDPSDFDDVAILDVFKNMKLEKYPKGTIFIREGEESNNKAYILMKGVVGCYRKKADFYMMQNVQAEAMEETDEKGVPSGRITPGKEHKPTIKFESSMLKNSLNNALNDSNTFDPRKIKKETEGNPLVLPADKDLSESRRLSNQSGDESNNDNSPPSSRDSTDILQIPVQREGQVLKKSLFGDLLATTIVKNHAKSLLKPGESPKSGFFQNTILDLKEGDETGKSKDSRASLNFDFFKKKRISEKPIPEDPYAHLGHHLHDISEKGELFGELALQLSSNRTASLVAKRDIILLSITKDIYTNMRRKRAVEEADQRSFLFTLVPFLDQVHNEESKREIVKNFNLTVFNRKAIPILEGEFGDEVLIVYEGIFLVTKTIYIAIDNDYIDKGDKYYQHYRNNKVAKEEIFLGYFGKGTVFGEEILMGKKNELINYRFTLQVTSETAKAFRVSRSALRLKVPLETTKELKASYLKKKENFDHELNAEIEKRKLFLISPNLDSHPLVVKRMQVKLVLPKQPKINVKANKIDTLKVLSTRANPSFLPKVLGAPIEAKESDPKNMEFLRSFSRYNFMPKSPDRNFEIVEESKSYNVSNARHILRPSFGGVHISSNDGKSPKNLDVCLNVIEQKFDIKLHSKAEHHKNLSNVDSFKFSFDGNTQKDINDKSKRFVGLPSPRTTKFATTINNNGHIKTMQSFVSTHTNLSQSPKPFYLQNFKSLTDQHLSGVKEPGFLSTQDIILLSPKERSSSKETISILKDNLSNLKDINSHIQKEPSIPSLRDPIYVSPKEPNEPILVMPKEQTLTIPTGVHSPKESIGAYIESTTLMTNNSDYQISNHGMMFSPELPSIQKLRQRISVHTVIERKVNKSVPKISNGVNKFSDKVKLNGVIQKAKENLIEFKLKMLEQQMSGGPLKKEAYLYKCFV